MKSCVSVLVVFSIFFSLQAFASAFSFTHTDPTQCDNITVKWEGGTAPYQLFLIPIFDSPRNISVPSSAFSNGKGSYSVQVPFAQGKQMLISMSDASGFGTGGISNVLTVGTSRGSSCDTRAQGVQFTFQLNTALIQCRNYTFSAYNKAIQPITIYGLIPLGQPFLLHPPSGPTSFDWVVNVASGTNLIFFMVDSTGKQGGTSDVLKIGISDDSTCITNLSPSVTATQPSVTPGNSSNQSNGGISIAAIAGTVIGAVLFLAIVITLSLYFFRRRRDRPFMYPPFSPRSEHPPPFEDTEVPGAAPEPSPYVTSPIMSNASIYPLRGETFGSAAGSQHPSGPYSSYSRTDSVADYDLLTPNPYDSLRPPDASTDAGSSSAGSNTYNTRTSRTSSITKKGRSNVLQPPARYVVHTDAEDAVPGPDDNGVVELPPMYTERRPGLTIMNPTAEQSGSGPFSGPSTSS